MFKIGLTKFLAMLLLGGGVITAVNGASYTLKWQNTTKGAIYLCTGKCEFRVKALWIDVTDPKPGSLQVSVTGVSKAQAWRDVVLTNKGKADYFGPLDTQLNGDLVTITWKSPIGGDHRIVLQMYGNQEGEMGILNESPEATPTSEPTEILMPTITPTPTVVFTPTATRSPQ